nr:MAG TPA: hypothetical protein [Caudoviricetes sp.]
MKKQVDIIGCRLRGGGVMFGRSVGNTRCLIA